MVSSVHPRRCEIRNGSIRFFSVLPVLLRALRVRLLVFLVMGEKRVALRPSGYFDSTCRMARKASCGISTLPTCFMRFLPAFCFSSSLRLRVMSPP